MQFCRICKYKKTRVKKTDKNEENYEVFIRKNSIKVEKI
jgi:hypothetical protein